MWLVWLFSLLSSPVVLAGTELLQNADFENHFSSTNWWVSAATITPTSDAYHGHRAAEVTKQTHDYSAIEQTVTVKGGHRYYFRAHVKILNYARGKGYEQLSCGIMVQEKSNGKRHSLTFGITRHVQSHQWHMVGGDHKLPNFDISEARVFIRPEDHTVNYIVDYASLQEVLPLSGFPADANNRIDKIRKGDITISFDEIKVIETSGLFPFGSAVNARDIVNPSKKGYQDFFYKHHFSWAVLENHLKWTLMEQTRGHIDYDTAMTAINALHSHGIKVRGHNIFWESHSPKWVDSLSGHALIQAMEKRLHDVLGHFKGKLEHWDVDNEALHSDRLVKHSGNKNLTMWMFREAHKIDPHPVLFLNDFGALKFSNFTVALEDMAVYFKQAGVPVGAVGMMSHLFSPIDLAAIKARLDEVARAGLPMWITELTVEGVSEHNKPQMFDDLLRLYFSHPAIHGILIWGYWDQNMSRKQSALCTGSDCTPNDTGKRVSHLLQTEWWTHETHTIHKGQTVHIRGFNGKYNLRVKHNGHVIHEEQFSLGSSGTYLRVALRGTDTSPHVSNILIG